jgi:hypothetical protein
MGDCKFECIDCCKQIPFQHYNMDKNKCDCCVIIASNIEKECYTCKEVKNIKEFSRPQLFRCRKCTNAIARAGYARRKAGIYSDKPFVHLDVRKTYPSVITNDIKLGARF